MSATAPATYFTEAYTLDHLVQTYPKPYVALLDSVAIGGGMGIDQADCNGLRIMTERTKMAMPTLTRHWYEISE